MLSQLVDIDWLQVVDHLWHLIFALLWPAQLDWTGNAARDFLGCERFPWLLWFPAVL